MVMYSHWVWKGAGCNVRKVIYHVQVGDIFNTLYEVALAPGACLHCFLYYQECMFDVWVLPHVGTMLELALIMLNFTYSSLNFCGRDSVINSQQKGIRQDWECEPIQLGKLAQEPGGKSQPPQKRLPVQEKVVPKTPWREGVKRL